MPSFSDINKYIRIPLNESSPIKWSDSDVALAYDFAQKDWSIRTECLSTLVSVASQAGVATYPLSSFPKFLKFKKVIWNYGTAQAVPLQWFDYQDYPWPIQTQTNIPTGYTTHDDNLILLFTPNQVVSIGGLYVFSAGDVDISVSAFSASSGISQIPARYHVQAAEDAIAKLLKKFPGGSEDADKHTALYEKYIAECLNLNKRSADDTRQQYFKTYRSVGFGQEGDMGSGYTGRPLWQ